MLSTYTWPRYTSPRAPELDANSTRRVPLVIVGAGPVGLAAAVDAALHGLPVVLLDEDDTVSVGSRAVCHAKRTLEIFDRLGVGDRIVEKGVTWNVGRTYHREREVFSFDLLPEPGHHRPGMVNLQQYHVEQILVERAQALPAIDLRWRHKVVRAIPEADASGGVRLEISSDDGTYTLLADWLVAADGARSGIRRQLGLDMQGKVFQDRFLIADIVLGGQPDAQGRAERRFWFAPTFHAGESALMHRQPDNVWRMDFQLGCQADPEVEGEPERVRARVRAALDSQRLEGLDFELEWVSVYTFQCRRMASLRHGRVLFAGDSAHQVSPFGARGGNSGIQDADNLVWKLRQVIEGRAPEALLDSYDVERGAAADDNLCQSSRSTDFMTPKTRIARLLREAVLSLAAEVPAGRALVNSGRLSVPTVLRDSPLNTEDATGANFKGWMVPGAPLDDAPVRDAQGQPGWLLPHTGRDFVLLRFGTPRRSPELAPELAAPGVRSLWIVPVAAARGIEGNDWLVDCEGLAAQRCDACAGTCYLIRPDQHVVARWRAFDPSAVQAALARALAREVTA